MANPLSKKAARRARKQDEAEDNEGALSSAVLQGESHAASDETPEARPAWYFFNGTLVDPEFRQTIAELETRPVVVPAKVRNKKIKYWAYFKAMIEGDETVSGVACHILTADAVERLRTFETDAYTDEWIDIELEDGRVLRGRTFMSSWDPNSLHDFATDQ